MRSRHPRLAERALAADEIYSLARSSGLAGAAQRAKGKDMSIELANPDIVGALIGAAASLLTAIVTVALSRWLGDRDLKVLGGSTRSNVEGRWTGHFDQPTPAPGFPGHVDLKAEFQLKRKRVVGTVDFDINGRHFKLDCKGGFYEDRILTLQYRNTESDVRQHGIIMVQLSANGRSLTGKFTGYGSETESIVSGDAKLERQLVARGEQCAA